ncbi:hypothetical protein CCR75_000836 [Bremia lactucae]|uniref:Coatomer subunit epsilon n=1 Tax=Bremia lactucae TaxID=4779 RepID=A0A976FNG9_BRELC|nr:hypothetical protein CCR75_000836 [Bremia lactucae]
MAEPDELFMLKNQLWVGNYQNVISEGSMLNHMNQTLRNERDVYVYRAHVALGNTSFVLQSIPDTGNVPIALSAVKLWATYLSGQIDPEMMALTLKEWLADPTSSDNGHLLLLAGQIFAREGKFSDALTAWTRGNSLEHMLYMVHLYLEINRADFARTTVATMKSLEEDSTLTQLAQAWCLTLQGRDKADEATLHFQELADRFGSTSLLLNGTAVAFMAMENYVEAERLLLDALAKEPSKEDTLVNLIAVSAHLQKPLEAYLCQLQQVAPLNVWLQKYELLEHEFARMASTFV